MSDKSTDRVSYSFGMKLSLPTRYESADFHVSLTSDVQPGETPAQAFNRVKAEVQEYAARSYTQIRETETGLPDSESKNTGDVAVPAPAAQPKLVDPKVYRQQIKTAFSVLEAQKKITKSDFVKNYLNNKKTDDLSDAEVSETLNKLKLNFKELGL